MNKSMSQSIIVLVVLVSCQPAPNATAIPPILTPPPIPSTAMSLPTASVEFRPTLTSAQSLTLTQKLTETLAADSEGRFVVLTPSAQDELNRIWGYLQRIDWYDQYGYKPVFPSDPLIQLLVQKAREEKLANQDFQSLSRRFTDNLYNSNDYTKSYQAVFASFQTVEQVLPTFRKYNAKWGFKMFPTYTVRLTLYGTGGSYDYQSGTIILQTDPSGAFSGGLDPSPIIVHEAVHIGIEENIIQKYSIDQRTKERIVDKFVYSHFLSLFPGYHPQSVGDSSVDKYLSDDNAWNELPARINAYAMNK